MKTLKIASIIFIGGCFNHHNNFTIPKEKYTSNDETKIKIENCFFVTEDDRAYIDTIIMFQDGKVLLDEVQWGHFILYQDSLYIQFFHYDVQNFYVRDAIELFCTVKTANSIECYKERCEWCKKAYAGWKSGARDYHPPILYTRQTGLKPDSSKAWFHTKKWYKKQLK